MRYDNVVWEYFERRGLEHLRLLASADGIKAEGLVVVDSEEGVIRFRYSMRLRADWRLKWCGVFVPLGTGQMSTSLSLEPDGNWLVGTYGKLGVERNPRHDLANCVAFDIVDTPFPKTILVRCLDLAEGETKKIAVALVDNRRLSVDPVEQKWERLAPTEMGVRRYRCTSGGGASEFLSARTSWFDSGRGDGG